LALLGRLPSAHVDGHVMQASEKPAQERKSGRLRRANGLKQTATLDQQTADALIGVTGIGQGSSMPPKTPGSCPMTNSSGKSDFGDRNGPK
jgi:hypothetical protein